MQVHLRLFSHLRVALGRRDLDLELPEGATVATVLERLRSMVPSELESMISGGAEGGYRLVVLVNGRRTGPDKLLQDGDVITLLPPLGGG